MRQVDMDEDSWETKQFQFKFCGRHGTEWDCISPMTEENWQMAEGNIKRENYISLVPSNLLSEYKVNICSA